jgi:endonuclease/exonuclease/phosphatase family metal-dependent hydrolase
VTTSPLQQPSDVVAREGDPSPVGMALLNLKGGAMVTPGRYALDRLERISAQLPSPPPYFGLCEAKRYSDEGHTGLLDAAAVLSNVYGRPYVGTLGWSDRGPIAPAFFLDATVLRLARWHDGTSHPDYPDARNLAELEVRETGDRFAVILEHLHPSSPQLRLERARLLDRYGTRYRQNAVILGDLNCSPPGNQYPARDWEQASPRLRSHKAVQVDGKWVAASAPIAHLLEMGFHAVPDLAYATGTPAEIAYAPTVVDDDGRGETIDVVLVNNKDMYVPDSHRVYPTTTNETGEPDSDHHLVTCILHTAA